MQSLNLTPPFSMKIGLDAHMARPLVQRGHYLIFHVTISLALAIQPDSKGTIFGKLKAWLDQSRVYLME